MEEGIPEALVTPIAHEDLAAFPTLAGDGRHAALRPEEPIVPGRQGLGRFRQEPGGNFSPDPDEHETCKIPDEDSTGWLFEDYGDNTPGVRRFTCAR